MDNILLIDAYNALHRAANTIFGGKQPHGICGEDTFADPCKHKLASIATHCRCGARWHQLEGTCYGELYNTIYSFFRNLRPIVELFKPDKCFFVLEGHPKFRYDIFAEYKASRAIVKEGITQKQKDKFSGSVNDVVNILKYFPITVARAYDYEADDLVGSLCEDMKEESLTVLSNDTDYIQLLQRGYKNCQIYNPIKKVFMEAPEYPYVAWKSLNGDKSDSIPKILTPKKALNTINSPELFKQFLSVEENRSKFEMNRSLIEFRMVPPEDIILQEGNKDFDKVKELFKIMSFDSITNDESWQKFCDTFECIKY